MSTGTAHRPAAGDARAPVRPDRTGPRALTGAVVRQLRRGAAVVAVVAGGMPALVAVQYRGTLQAGPGIASLTALAENPAIRILFGPPVALDDPGGFTVWRTGTTLAVLVAVWAALAATRVTRGEEEAGRWDLLLAGSARLRSLVVRHLVLLLAAAGLVGGAVAVGLLLAGTATTGAVLFGAAVGGCGMVGAALGVLAAQLLPERRAASGLATAVLLAGLLLRMISDGVPALGWTQWLSPFGLLARTAPFAGDRVLPLLVLAAAVLALGGAAITVADRRDVGTGLFRGADRRAASSRLLRSLSGFAVHRTVRPLLGWAAGVAAYFLLIGVLATSLSDFLRDNPVFAEMAARAGVAGLDRVEGYVAALFALLAILVGAFAAARVAATAADESARRLTLLYAAPVHRVRWASAEAVTVAAGCAFLGVVAALATWAGARSVGAPLTLPEAVAGTLNVVPVALLCLGAALAALGWVPAAVLPLGVLPAAGGYLLLVLADTFGWPGWVRWFSPFDHLAAVPAEPVDPAGTLGMLAVAALLAATGLAGYARRDLRG